MPTAMLDHRADALRKEHAALEIAIQEEAGRPVPDDMRLSEMKRQKLRIKDELARIGPP